MVPHTGVSGRRDREPGSLRFGVDDRYAIYAEILRKAAAIKVRTKCSKYFMLIMILIKSKNKVARV